MKEEIIDLEIAKIKVKPREEKKIVLIGKCPFCKRELRAITQNQFDWNMILHIRQKHKNDEETQILLKQLEEQQKAKIHHKTQ